MKLRHSDRSLIAWALYFCVLMNLFADLAYAFLDPRITR